ncbi:DNA polymerase III subunit gamma/tau [Spiroplasma tabanidicola]|uniref:DNA polymerase III subunit gamma/tau n=1 Tax=Spiroplasma tabanidicola TaxID=324079 RepID=A0A6I6CBM2_9MOLU|nr:DNA polymerase III subunit gamma/tau [Spiroplasma tabanidicola]QGS51374.1 DNA polymerase III subunits gamma and tau [Spiroplasma tabanidicola]
MENKKSLYRIYRPKSLDEVAGHEGIKEIIKSQISKNNYPHALLFSGQRGTGKTSIAKIFAKIVNCQNLIDNKTCNECKSCIEFDRNSHPDIFEMDAASNNGVDEIRNIKANVSTLPAISKYKVYIIDEVHMLTNSAFNALLKTLEEPPSHVVFILATTEFSKIPATIVSRCQLFNFKKIAKKSLENKIREITIKENSQIDNEALEEIFYMSDGSLRDALNYLEQTLTVAKEKITIEELKKVFYISTKKEKLEILKNVFNKNVKGIITYFEKANNQGLDFNSTILGILNIVKELITIKMTNEKEHLKVLNDEDIKFFENTNLKDLFLLAENISEAFSKTKNSNVSYQYILISILKTVAELSTLISVDNKSNGVIVKNQNQNTFNSNLEESVDEVTSVVVEKQTLNEKEKEVKTKITDQEVETQSMLKQKEDEKRDNSQLEVILNITDEETKLYRLQLAILKKEVESLETEFEIKDDQILNVLVGANKEARKTYEKLFGNLIYNNLNNIEELQNFICFYKVKIRAGNEDAVIMVVEENLNSKWINDKLQDKNFRENIFKVINKRIAIICIDKKRWDHIREEYTYKKDANILHNNYKKIDVETFYKSLKKVETENVFLERAKKLLNLNIKVVD